MINLPSKFVLTTASIFISNLAAFAQADFLDSSASAYLDNVLAVRPSRSKVDEGSGMFKIQGFDATGSELVTTKYWDIPRYSISYGFVRRESKLADQNETDINNVAPEVTFKNADRFSVIVGPNYSHSSTEGNGNVRADSDTYGVAATPAQEILHFFPDTIFGKDEITFGTQLGYKHSDSTKKAAVTTTESSKNAFSIGPNLVYKHKLTKDIALSIVPAYSFEYAKNSTKGGADYNTSGGIFAILSRVDYNLSDSIFITATSQWKHDVNQHPAPNQSSRLHDWGEFGAALGWQICTRAGLRIGYSYEGFNPDFRAHKATARLDVSF